MGDVAGGVSCSIAGGIQGSVAGGVTGGVACGLGGAATMGSLLVSSLWIERWHDPRRSSWGRSRRRPR